METYKQCTYWLHTEDGCCFKKGIEIPAIGTNVCHFQNERLTIITCDKSGEIEGRNFQVLPLIICSTYILRFAMGCKCCEQKEWSSEIE